MKSPASLLLAALLAVQGLYFLFMDAKLGARQDIDLFWTFYLLLALAAGRTLEDAAPADPERRTRYAATVLSAAAAVMIVHLYVFRLAGLPAA